MLPLLLALACSPDPATTPAGIAPEALVETDTGTESGSGFSFSERAYETCIADSDCDAGASCRSVSGHATAYCAPACDPAGDGSECGVGDMKGVCAATGWCARSCGDPDTCPDDLACAEVDDLGAVCAGEELGTAGYYGTCTHPQVEGPDCPEQSSCYGGDLLGIEDGVCLPWCDDNVCQPIPDDTQGVTPFCYDVGLDHPVCALLCQVEDSVCPTGQECMDLGFTGLCIPEGSDLPIEPGAPGESSP